MRLRISCHERNMQLRHLKSTYASTLQMPNRCLKNATTGNQGAEALQLWILREFRLVE